jgi:hypothetical protein
LLNLKETGVCTINLPEELFVKDEICWYFHSSYNPADLKSQDDVYLLIN